MNLVEFAGLLQLANPYQERYSTDVQKEIRKRPRLASHAFVLSLLYLVGGTNAEGYDHALCEVFGDDAVPFRSSLSKARKRVSWEFFRDALYELIHKVEGQRTTYGGLKLFAIDGHQVVLPYTKDLYAAGYNGRYLEDNRETHTLRGYMTHCFDVLTGLTCDVALSPLLDEHRDRRKLIKSVPSGSLVIYDRLYFSQDLAESHSECEQRRVYFLARCRRNASKEVAEFFASPDVRSSTGRYGKRIYFFKVFHPGTNDPTVYATDLPESWHNVHTLGRLYRMRWEIETEQRDITATVKMEQWHSTTLNGILQEFYATLWLVNMVRVTMLVSGAKSVSPEDDEYRKPNFKLCFNFFVKRLKEWLAMPGALLVKMGRLIKRSTETRRRYSRSYPRELKGPDSAFPRNNTVPSSARPPPGR